MMIHYNYRGLSGQVTTITQQTLRHTSIEEEICEYVSIVVR